jgi:hypothetical protein
MERKEITRRAWMYLADYDEYAKIVIDGKITQACELIADFIENLIDNGVLAEPVNDASALPIPDVSHLACDNHAFTFYDSRIDDYICIKCGKQLKQACG